MSRCPICLKAWDGERLTCDECYRDQLAREAIEKATREELAQAIQIVQAKVRGKRRKRRRVLDDGP